MRDMAEKRCRYLSTLNDARPLPRPLPQHELMGVVRMALKRNESLNCNLKLGRADTESRKLHVLFTRSVEVITNVPSPFLNVDSS